MSVSRSQVGDHGTRGSFGAIIAFLEHLHISRRFGNETLPYHLKVRVLKLRLCRWHDRMAAGGIGGADDDSVRVHLSSIDLPSGEKVDPQTREILNFDNWMIKEIDWLSQKHYTPGPRKPGRISLDETGLNKLIAHISNVAEKLEELIQPTKADGNKDQLSGMRLKDANHINGRPEANPKELQILEQVAAQVDPKFASLVAFRDGHQYTNTQIEGAAQTGDDFADGWEKGAVGNSHKYHDTVVGSKGIALVGNKYGGPSIFAGLKSHRF
ncbi:hypothetical protein F4680DRAFT_441423 [Xylaria scruposa]|nr:hypothetical protein F4680DRAFT_441423 [Xylaria scruposa]